MKKIFLSLALFVACVVAIPAHAQMMGARPTVAGEVAPVPTASAAAVTAGAPAAKPVDVAMTADGVAAEEAQGKALWDKLQNKQIQCQDLKDADFDVIGDFFMGSMAGASHEKMNALMAERLGNAGETQMHIAMGKRLSGCDPSAAYPSGSEYFAPMIGAHMGMMNSAARVPIAPPIDPAQMMRVNYDGERGGHESIPFVAFGVLIGLAALAFFTLGGIYYWKEIEKQGLG